MKFGDPRLALGLLSATLLIGLIALRVLVKSWVERAAVAERSALEVAESRASRPRYKIDRRLLRTAFGRALRTRLSSAGVDMLVIDFLFICAAAFFTGYFLVDILAPPWLSAIAGALCVRVCFLWVERQRGKRREAFVNQLPEMARLLSNASSAGLAIRSAIEMASQELDDPAGTELAIVAEELALGQSVARALANLEARMPARDVGVLISTLIIQQRSGGDLVHALQDMSATLEDRRDLAREVKTVMAGSVFTGYMVAIIGLGTVLVMNVISPGVIDKLTSSFIGLLTLGVAGGLYVVGFLLIRRVTRVEV